MSLQVWLPLNKNVIENKGLSDVKFTNSNPSGITFVDSGIESCYNFSGYSGNGIYTLPVVSEDFMDMYINHHSFSLCAWFKTSSTYTAGTPIMYLTYGLGLWCGSITRIILYNRARTIRCNANVTTNDNKWHHICGTYDISDNKIRIYIDGQLKNTVSYADGETYASSWANGLFIGRDPNNVTERDDYYFQGSLSDIRIYDHALSDKEVYELAKGLMFHLKLDNTDLYDCSGYGWDVSKYSSGTLSENSDTARYNKSLIFDGNVSISTQANLNNSETVTVACWAKPNNANLNALCGFADSGNWWQFVIGGYSEVGENKLCIRDNGDGVHGTRYEYSLGTIEANKWIHIVCSYNKGTAKIYKNGELFSTNTTGGSALNSNMVLNKVGSNNNANFNGSISDFRIYRTALTDEQVRELYKVGGSIDNHGNAHCYEVIENGDWYRICKGGIYTTTNAYINTGYKDFTNRNFEYYIDCKVLDTTKGPKGLTGAVNESGSKSYNSITYIGDNTHEWWYDMYYPVRYGSQESNISQWLTLRPFLNKKVRINQPINQSGYYPSIQLYNGSILENPLYTTYDENNYPDNICPYPMTVFAIYQNGNIYRNANNVVIYETQAKQQNITMYSLFACQLTQNITADLAWDNQPHYSGEYGMYDEITHKFFGNANSTGYFLENFD